MSARCDVLLVDDHPLVLDGVRARLDAQPGLRVLGTVEQASAVETEVARLQPDIVFMDISLPDGNGLELTRRLTERWPEVAVIVLTMHGNREYVQKAMDCGARGYILKSAPSSELVQAVETVMGGEPYFSVELSRRMVADILCGGKKPKLLTSRQQEVLNAVARGKTSKETAVELGISPRTVETHREAIMKRLRVHSAAELTREAIKRGLVVVD
jgi:two-component system, NarL family, nitrate/nitrite response regulator NarL